MKLIALTLGAALAALAADPAGFKVWKGAELKGAGKKLAPKVNAQKVATEQLGTFGNHLLMVAHREGNGEAEWHDTQADIFIVQSGEATLIYGGQMVDAKTTAPNEQRGPSISGGSKVKLGPGDVAHVPAKTPHQVMVENGKQFTYAMVKVDVK